MQLLYLIRHTKPDPKPTDPVFPLLSLECRHEIRQPRQPAEERSLAALYQAAAVRGNCGFIYIIQPSKFFSDADRPHRAPVAEPAAPARD